MDVQAAVGAPDERHSIMGIEMEIIYRMEMPSHFILNLPEIKNIALFLLYLLLNYTYMIYNCYTVHNYGFQATPNEGRFKKNSLMLSVMLK